MAKLKTDLSGNNSNIRVERAYAKSIGVKSPTVLTKSQLDEAVRVREVELGIVKEKRTIYDFTPEQRTDLYNHISQKPSIQMYTGYFVPFEEGDGVLRRDPFEIMPELDVYVPADFVKAYNMHMGDRVVGNVCTLYYNNVRVLKNVRYFNDETTTGRTAKIARYDDMDSVTPDNILRIDGNNTIASIIQNVLNMSEGQSIAVTGLDESNIGMFEDVAIEIYSALNMRFAGELFGMLDIEKPESLPKVYKLRNPESLIINGIEKDKKVLLEMIKRAIERKSSALVVIFAIEGDAEDFINLAKATNKAAVTVIAFVRECDSANIILPFKGNKIMVSKIRRAIGENSSFTYKKAMKLKEMPDCTPEELLSKFMEQENE